MLAALFAALLISSIAVAQTRPYHQIIVADADAPAHPFPHFWEKMFGSGRAILSLRESYRNDLRDVKQITGFTTKLVFTARTRKVSLSTTFPM